MYYVISGLYLINYIVINIINNNILINTSTINCVYVNENCQTFKNTSNVAHCVQSLVHFVSLLFAPCSFIVYKKTFKYLGSVVLILSADLKFTSSRIGTGH